MASSTSPPGGDSGYEPAYPNNIPTDSSVKRFISEFFEVSDTPGSIDEWVSYFRNDATVIMGNDVAKGKEGQSCPAKPAPPDEPTRMMIKPLQRSAS